MALVPCAKLGLLAPGVADVRALCAGLVLAHVVSRAWPLLVIRWLPMWAKRAAQGQAAGRRDQRQALAWRRCGAGRRWRAWPGCRACLRAGAAAAVGTGRTGHGAPVCAAAAGFTGDCLGATQQVCEIACYLGLGLALVLVPWLWLARHAAPLAPSGLCYGATDLEAEGDATPAGGPGPGGGGSCRCGGAQFAAAPLPATGRALQVRRPGGPHRARLREMDFGTWEGQRWEGDRARPLRPVDGGLRAASLRRRRRRGPDGAGGGLEERAGGQDVLWITHAGVARAVRLLVRGVARAAAGLAARRTRVRRLGEPRAGPGV